MACSVLMTENCSMFSPCLPRFLRPAVSTSVYFFPLRSKGTSIGSMVVPGLSKAMTRSSPTSAFTSVDLPTLGRPTMATRGQRSRSSSSCSSSSGNSSSTASMSSRMPSPCAAEIDTGKPRPSCWKSAEAVSGCMPSALLTAIHIRGRSLRNCSAMRRSSGVSPARASVRKITASASAIACWVCFAISAKMPSVVRGSSPPVSTTWYGRLPSRPSP